MTRSPLLATFCALVPLVALAFPLAKILNPEPVEQQVEKPAEDKSSGEAVSAVVVIRCGYPFEQATIGATFFKKGEDEKEVTFDSGSPIDILITWPEGTPESAALVEIMPEGEETISQVFWGYGGTAVGEITITP
ncbi:MAG: hypothetical protein ACON5H_02210 [Akkermansiaceae bacterium]